MMRHAFPGLQAYIEDIVAARVRFRGTHTGEFPGFAATDRQGARSGGQAGHRAPSGLLASSAWASGRRS
jgi:hypothetical protein